MHRYTNFTSPMHSITFQPSGRTPQEMHLGLDEDSVYMYDNGGGSGKREVKYMGPSRRRGPPPGRMLYGVFIFEYSDGDTIYLKYSDIVLGRRNGNFSGGLAR